MAARAGVSTEHLHAESGHARLLRGGCASSEDAGPVYPSSPGASRLQKRGPASQQTSPSESSESCTWAVAGQRACGRSRTPTAAHQGSSCPRCAGPTVSTPLAETTLRRRPQSSTGSRRGPAQTSRGCDSRRPPGLPGEKEGRACSCQHRDARPGGPVRGGAPLQERDAPQPPPRAPAIRQGRRTASRCAACDRQERR